jgi:hypothetical protein
MSLSKTYENTGKKPGSCHSRYAPEAEARRHLDSILAGRRPALIFILGAGRNYLGKVIRQSLPWSMTVVLQVCTDFDADLVDPGDLYWSPGSPYTLESILTSALSSGKAAGGIALVEWPPASSSNVSVLEAIRARLHQALELYSSESATSAYWGRRWLRNSIDFVCAEGALAFPCTDSTPLVLACAGPGLQEALAAIRASRNRIRLWSLASSHQALMSAGLEPELVLGTDPGFWNGAHLALAARKGSILAATPSTKLGSAILDGPCSIVPVCTGLGFELDALAAAGDLPAIKAAAAGTAAWTALSVARTLNSGQIYLCGLDLAAYGLYEHTSPYAFDILDELMASRQRPALASRFSRVMDRYPESQGSWRFSRAFSAYAFDAASGRSTSTCIRVSDSPVDTQLTRIRPDQLASVLASGQPVTGTEPEMRFFYRQRTVQARLDSMIERLAVRSNSTLATLQECASTGQPVPRETVLELFAFGGKSCAAAVASAARKEASRQELREAENSVRTNLRHLAERDL